MNATRQHDSAVRAAFNRGAAAGVSAMPRWRWDCVALGLLIAVLNAPLLFGRRLDALAFRTEAWQAGEWWRLATHPWIHAGLYHLVLDASAFLMLYVTLRTSSASRRLLLVAGGIGGGIAAAWTGSALFSQVGFCGLSAVAHGLMAEVGLEMCADRAQPIAIRAAGALCFWGAVAKAVAEALLGHVLLVSWHFGSVGCPIAISHAGGVLGVLAVSAALRVRR